MDDEAHVARSVPNGGVGVGCGVLEKMEDGILGAGGGFGLAN